MSRPDDKYTDMEVALVDECLKKGNLKNLTYADATKYGYEKAEKDVIVMVKKHLEMGHQRMEQSQEHPDELPYFLFWDGFHSCAQSILRELENKE